MLAIARTINLPDTLAEVMATSGTWPVDGSFDVEVLAAVLQRRIDARRRPSVLHRRLHDPGVDGT
jgi:hypothetical protein